MKSKWQLGAAVGLILALMMAALAGPLVPKANAQTAGTASIVGTVTDPAGAVVPDAEVTLKNVDTGATRTLQTGTSGLFAFPYLQPGRYELRVRKSGFAEVIRQNIVVAVGQTATVDIQLSLQTAQQTVTVTAAPQLVETQKTDVSQVVNSAQVENLPLNGRRWDNLVLLTAGVSEDGGFGLISFRGISGLYNNNMVDGADNNQAFFSEARGRTRIPYGYSLDAIKEFQVTAAAYSAEYGRAAGGIVNAITKSGTNEFHGDAFYFIRDDLWLARDPIANASGQPKPDERRQQFGGSVGGPILHDRLFFFANYDQQKRNFPAVVTFSNPTTWQQQIANCPGNPTPTAAECQQVVNALNPLFNTIQPRQGNNYIGLGKLDWQVNANNRISGEVNVLRWDSPNGIQTSPVLNVTELANGGDFVHNQFVNAHWSSVITPTLVNEARFQWGEDFEFENANHSGPNFGFNTSSIGGASFGMPNFLPRGKFPDEIRYEWIDNLSWVHGRQEWKFGVDVNHVHDSVQNLFQGGGIYNYSGSNALRNFVNDIFHGTRSYSTFVQAVDPITGNGSGAFSTNEFNAYVQNTFHWRPNFTVYAGLRYEIQLMPDVIRANPLVPESSRLNTDKNNFAPRLGFAWDLGGHQTQVIRGGYGIYYGRTQNSTIFNALFQNGVFQQTFSVRPSQGPACAPLVPNILFPQPSTAPALSPIFGSSGPTPSVMYPSLAAFLAACTSASGSSAVDVLDPSFVNPLVHEYDVAYERRLPGDFALTLNYVGSRGLHLPIVYDVNLPPPDQTAVYLIYDTTGTAVGQFSVPFFSGTPSRPRPNLGPVLMAKSIVNSWYNGLVVRLRRQIASGFSFDMNFTWSKAIDDGQVAGNNGTFFGTNSPLNPYDIRSEYGLSDLDIRRRFITNFYWVTPFGNWVHNAAGKAFLNGWRFSGIIRAQDGRPVTAFMRSSPSCSSKADFGLTCGAISGTAGFTNGRVPFFQRNTHFTMPAIFIVDFRVNRTFQITERSSFEFIWEAFNLFNRTNVFGVDSGAYNFINPNGSLATPLNLTLKCPATLATTGVYKGCIQAVPTFLTPTSTGNTLYGARQMQFGARFRF